MYDAHDSDFVAVYGIEDEVVAHDRHPQNRPNIWAGYAEIRVLCQVTATPINAFGDGIGRTGAVMMDMLPDVLEITAGAMASNKAHQRSIY
jgi:hypothetical protein